MFLSWRHDAVRLTGRWTGMQESQSTCHAFLKHDTGRTSTTAAGSYFELAFQGRMAVLHFDTGYHIHPTPHLWIETDGGARVEVPLDRRIRVTAAEDGEHVVRVTLKSAMEMLHRWHEPLQGALSFIGAEVDAPGTLPPDERTLIEFVGDSITEGVLTDATYPPEMDFIAEQHLRPYDDDSTATYACLTARQLNLRAMYQGYGGVGVTRSGCGGVPRAALIYPYAIDCVPFAGEIPRIVVINHGANDRGNSAQCFAAQYMELLDAVRARAPQALIVCLSPFCGAFDAQTREMVARYNESRRDCVEFVSSLGWVPEEPLHPRREAHAHIASLFAPILRSLMDKHGIA